MLVAPQPSVSTKASSVPDALYRAQECWPGDLGTSLRGGDWLARTRAIRQRNTGAAWHDPGYPPNRWVWVHPEAPESPQSRGAAPDAYRSFSWGSRECAESVPEPTARDTP